MPLSQKTLDYLIKHAVLFGSATNKEPLYLRFDNPSKVDEAEDRIAADLAVGEFKITRMRGGRLEITHPKEVMQQIAESDIKKEVVGVCTNLDPKGKTGFRR